MGLLEPWSFGFLTFPKTCQDFKRKNETELSCSLSHHRRIPFREKILWTGISLFVFLVCCQIPILGCKMLQLHTHTHSSACKSCSAVGDAIHAQTRGSLGVFIIDPALGYMGFLQTSPQSHGWIDETFCPVDHRDFFLWRSFLCLG